jgi:hypothetical protein
MFSTSSADRPLVIVPVRPPAARLDEAPRPAGLLRRAFGRNLPSRRTLGRGNPSRRTFGRGNPSRRTFGRGNASRRTFGRGNA